ncbi:polyadenylate-binding protein [Vigna unguiculata]|uniref:Polyadenylate-binding protein n=1 Tax=Vigna unguiculata TaxID=3917 RepID=A0A4D6M0M6_VIGUN|nr:polyadenylate-binding protein [Vigna unguiculata]QCD94437.1 polyadenylate-binding protein [Vigna unguiculata]
MAAMISSAPMAVPATALNGAQFGNASLYVGDLDANVIESQLFDLFSQVAQVVSIRVCRDQTRRTSLGYAYVNFANVQDAAIAMEHLNFTPLNGKPIRIMFSHRDPSIRKSGFANVFIKNLDASVDNKALYDTFAAFGNVLSSKVQVDENGQSKGYGFVQFDNDESAQNAIKKLNGMLINDKKVYVGLFVRRQERAPGNDGSPKFTNVYVKNLSETYTEEDLKQLFSTYGTITSVVVMKDAEGKSRCFGFVNFESADSAATAVERLNGTTINDDKVLYVGRAQRKAEREAELKAKFEQEKRNKFDKLQGANLYLKNFDDSFNDEKLKEIFSVFGTTTSCKVMMDALGRSKGCGFVAFSTPEEATRAMNEMNGKIIGQKPLYVAVAQRKEERKANLQAQFSHMQIAPFSAGITGYHPAYFGPGTTGFVSPQATGYGFQPQVLPQSMRGVPPNFMMPYPLQRQGPPGQRMVPPTRRVTLNHSLPIPNVQNGMHQYVMPHHLVSPVAITAPPTDVKTSATSSTTLASALASASPENQHRMLGEHLYPLVERLTPSNQTAKVTGMLLEMDQAEVIHLIESPEDLKTKVSEAMKVLHEAAAGSEVGDQTKVI